MSKFQGIISQIIKDSPAGEIKDVYNDLITIAGQDSKQTILEEIEKYNIENNVCVSVGNDSVILSKYNKSGTKYFDPITNKLFSVDHLNKKGLDIEVNTINELNQSQKALYNELKKYTEDDFSGNVVAAVYPDTTNKDNLAIIIVSTKYSPNNFWTGDWRSIYNYDTTSKKLTGKIGLKVHYYEGGNVNFKSNEVFEENGIEENEIIKTIRAFENKFEKDLDFSFNNLNEREFKSLRRRLPISRTKVNWGGAIGNYKLGKDAAESQL